MQQVNPQYNLNLNNNVQPATSIRNQKILGAPIATYSPRKRQWYELLIWPLPGFIIAIVLIIAGLDWYYYGYTGFGPIAAKLWSWDWLLWGMVIGGFTLMVSAWQVYRSRIKVCLYRYGITIQLPLHKTRTLRWDEINGISSASIHEILLGHSLCIHHQLKILTNQGKSYTFDDRISHLLELTTRLKANLYPRILPKLRIRFKDGHPLIFGPVTIDLHSVKINQKNILWDQVCQMTVINGHLIIMVQHPGVKKPKHHSIPVYQIPNLELLMQLLQQGHNPIP